MKCPNCNETLLMSHRNNIEIDHCPSCRGIWLDKGELDKMLEYAEHKYDTGKTDPLKNHKDNMYDDRNRHGNHTKPYKKKSFLGDLFDFD